MRYFDLHCDTLVACLDQNKSLIDNDLHVSVKKGDRFAPYVQCAAVWLPDSVRGAAALQYFDRHAAYFRKMAETGAFTVLETGEDLEKLGNKQGTAFILTVEGGSAVAGDLKNIHHLRENGVRVMTLTWNGSNEIGSGVMSGDKFGLTPFGKLAVKEMEKEGIVIDVSHASEALFYDVAENTERPFIATHSNSKVLCKHPRNLTDDQFRIICNRGGLVGLNYFKAFLNDDPAKADIEDLFARRALFVPRRRGRRRHGQ